jgi:hypothetical protein
MKVVPFGRYKNRQMVEVLQALAAKATAGEIIGLAVCFKNAAGVEDAIITGQFADNADMGAAAALRLSVRLARAWGEYD